MEGIDRHLTMDAFSTHDPILLLFSLQDSHLLANQHC